jgi:hypothetical protein
MARKRDLITFRSKDFCLSSVGTGSGDHRIFYPASIGGFSHGVKLDVDSTRLSGKEKVKLFL